MPYKRTGRPPGRPPYPGPLTPAEERVLDGVRRGLSNPQIAAELGVSPDAVKYHVANMLSKLGLSDRHALAAWQPVEPAVAGRRWWLGGWAALRRPAGVALAGLGVAGIVWVAVLATRGGREEECRDSLSCVDTTTASPSADVTATPVARPAVFDELRRRPLRLPVVQPGAECPVTVMGRSGLVETGVGAGTIKLGFTQLSIFRPLRNSGDRYALTGDWSALPGISGPVLFRSGRIDGDGLLNFEGSGSTLEVLDISVERLPRMLVDGPGCYAIQVDTVKSSEVVVLAVNQTVVDPRATPSPTEVESEAPATGDLVFTVSSELRLPRTYLAGVPDGATGEPGLGHLQPAWSPDGRLIVSIGCFDDACNRLVRLDDADGTDLRSMEAECGGVSQPSWAPDSRRVAIQYFACDASGPDIRVFDTQDPADHLTPLRPIAGHELTPAWSPDGEWIAFTRERQGEYDICLARPDGSGVRCPVERIGFDAYPSWSPDGSTLLFESFVAGRRSLWLVAPDGSGLRELAPGDGSAWFGAWSPDGAHVAFSSDRDGEGFRIYVVEAASGDIVRGEAAGAWWPKWSLDGSTIAFLATVDGRAEVYTMSPDGTGTERVTDVRGGAVTYFEWVRPTR